MAMGAPVEDITEEFERRHRKQCKRCQEYGVHQRVTVERATWLSLRTAGDLRVIEEDLLPLVAGCHSSIAAVPATAALCALSASTAAR